MMSGISGLSGILGERDMLGVNLISSLGRRRFGYTGTAIANAFAAASAGDTIVIGPGAYTAPATTFNILDRLNVVVMGVITQSDGSVPVFTANGVSSWTLTGRGRIVGARQTGLSGQGLYMTGAQTKFVVSDLEFYDCGFHGDPGFAIYNASTMSGNVGGLFSNLHISKPTGKSGGGIYLAVSTGYTRVLGCHMQDGIIGLKDVGGNNFANGCVIQACDYALWAEGAQNLHGSFVGGCLNHCSNAAYFKGLASGYGYLLASTYIAGSTNIITFDNVSDIRIHGCQFLTARFNVANSPGQNYLQANYLSSTITNNAAQAELLCIDNVFEDDGLWTGNHLQAA